ncbi:two-component system OmpR family sensor kinase [Tamaricihabitans halophyticus]|uniref:histidine kinase n=1 Tax=Tamaricihabitans halophyticus TaxID=1262583 RepID=A0A4V6NRE7_9PSEU|nr:HAMP domain-containing sensor histidine kinase [Tamaricihabitans halophyticus]TCP55266.1 two-component system OmpR family sensor kinase [Tamaricihabitans halophyticus]
MRWRVRTKASLRTRLIIVVVGLLTVGLGVAVGATFGALQDWDDDRYTAQLAEISPAAVTLHAAQYAELTGRVARIAIGTFVVTLLVLALLAARLITRELRPLNAVTAAAVQLGDGELNTRVADTGEGTEIGRLGGAFNEMAGQLERTFAERVAVEKRLRRFVADASHELRTPVATIRGYAELFHRGAADRPDDLAKVMRRIEAEAARMGLLVDDLLLLARLDEGSPPLREPVDLLELVTDAVADARATEPDRPIRLDATTVPPVSGDASSLRQVLGNLLGNVARHTPPTAPATVTLRSARNVAVISVTDSGPGLDDTERAAVFDRFYRADQGRSREHGGAGLGLAIVAAIATAHGGRVRAFAPAAGGAGFEVRLPLGDSPDLRDMS